MNKKVLIILSLGIIIILYITGCSSEKIAEQSIKKISVKVAPVEFQEMAQVLHTYGRLVTKKEMKLSFKIPGIIARIFVDEGQKVKKDQILARLNPAEIDSQVKQARSALAKADRDKERVENLYEEKAATLEQFQNVTTAFQIAQSQLQAAEFNLKHAEIYAPDKGRILKRMVEENEMVGAGTPIFFFASTGAADDWIIRAGISDIDLFQIKMNDPALVFFDAYPEETFSASVSEIGEAADPFTGTYEIELKIESKEKRLVSGLIAKIDISPSLKQNYAVIPLDALVGAEGKKGFVFTVDSETKTAKRIPMSIGFLFEDKVAVTDGLDKIEKVITLGSQYLSDGAEVEIILNQKKD